MISSGLERVIQQGSARAHTYTFGGSGVGRIPCPENSFLIIHHFDYFHFIDVPEATAAPAVGGLNLSNTDPLLLPFTATFDFGVVGNFLATVDFNDAAGTLISVQTGLTGIAPGWSVGLVAAVPFTFRFTFTTTSPGAAYNGIVPGFLPTVPQPTVTDTPIAFAGGDVAVVSLESFLQHTTHQLEFRSKKGRNHFVINEPVKIFTASVLEDSTAFFANCGGHYSKDTYLVHTEPVQINVVGVPPVANWNIVYSTLAPDSQEFPLLVGYGTTGFASVPAVREIYFSGAGLTQQYLPLTAAFENIPAVTGQYREEFKVDVNAANALFPPGNNSGVLGNFLTYPLINIDYVQVDMNYNEYVKASNG